MDQIGKFVLENGKFISNNTQPQSHVPQVGTKLNTIGIVNNHGKLSHIYIFLQFYYFELDLKLKTLHRTRNHINDFVSFVLI